MAQKEQNETTNGPKKWLKMGQKVEQSDKNGTKTNLVKEPIC